MHCLTQPDSLAIIKSFSQHALCIYRNVQHSSDVFLNESIFYLQHDQYNGRGSKDLLEDYVSDMESQDVGIALLDHTKG